MKKPYYNFKDFKNACDPNRNDVILSGKAQKDSDRYFNLRIRSQVLDFISNGGLEDLRFINPKPWEKNLDKNNPVMIDAYEFRTLGKLGYIAFGHNNKTGKWYIKSFKPSENTNPSMVEAFQRARRIKCGDNK